MVTQRSAGLSGSRLASTVVMVGGFVAALVGSSMRFITVGRTVLRVELNISVAIENVSPSAKHAVVIAALVGVVAALLSQIPYSRWLAVVTLACSVGVLWASLYALDRAYKRGITREGVLKALTDPRPATGFWVLIVGAGCAGLGSLVTLLSRRSAAPSIIVVGGTGSPPHGPLVTSRSKKPDNRAGHVPRPDPRPAWHPDPAGSGLLRWWDGARWAPEPMTSEPLPPPATTVVG